MKKDVLHADEELRIQVLHALNILDTVQAREFDDITFLASQICQTPISLISLFDNKRQWLMSLHGLDELDASEDVSLSAHAVFQNGLLEIKDTLQDARFIQSPLVTGPTGARFYAGVPILDSKHALPIGVLCVLDHTPRSLGENQKRALLSLSDQVSRLLQIRFENANSELYKALFSQSADPIMTLAPPSWKFTGCNPAALKMFEIADEAAFKELGHWDLSPPLQSDQKTSEEKARQMIAIAMQSGSHSFDWTLKTMSGKELECRVLFTKVDVGGQSYLQASVRDVSNERKAVAKVMEQAEILERVYRNAPMGILELDKNLRVIRCNPTYERMLEYSEAELVGISILDLTHPEDKTRSFGMASSISQADGHSEHFEKRYIAKSGKILRAKVTSKVLKDSTSNSCFLSIIEDITAIAEKQLEASTILETMSEGLLIQGANGQVEKFNPEALTILGVSGDQLLGRTPTELAWNTVREDESPYPDEERPALFALRTNTPLRDEIVGLNLPSGKRRWIRVNAIPFQTAKERKVACTFSDITNVINADRELKYIFKYSRDLMCIAGPDGMLKRLSPSFSQVLGWSEEELLKQPFIAFVHPDDAKLTLDKIGSLAAGSLTGSFENRCRTKAGDYRLLSWVWYPDHKSAQLYATARDVTDQRRLDTRNAEIYKAIDNAAIIAFTDRDGSITEVNENFTKISGYSREELIGQNHRMLNSGKHPKRFFQDLWKTISSGGTWTGDITNRAKDGRLYFVRSVITPIKSLSGQIEQYIAVRFDVSAAKRIESELVEAQSTAKIGSWKYDFETGELYWSSEHYRIFEIEEAQESGLLNILHRERIHPEDLAEFDAKLARASSRFESFSLFHRIWLDDGRRIKHVRCIGNVSYDSLGNSVSIAGTCQDVTSEIIGEQQLMAALNLNEAIKRSAKVAIITTDVEGQITDFNTEAERILGYAAKEVVGKTPAVFHDPQEVADWAAVLSLAYQIDVPVGFETFVFKARRGLVDERRWTYIRKDGAKVSVFLTISALLDANGKLSGFMGIARDISEEIALESQITVERARSAQNAKLASLGEMSAGVAHEINNPLSIIVGTIPLLGKFKDDPVKFAGKLGAIARAADRIERIVRGLKKFSRSSEGNVHKSELLKDLVNEALVLVDAKSRRHLTPITADVADELRIICDAVEIEQVLINLINNGIDAAKSSQEKWVKIHAFAENSEVVLRVFDSGPGIQSEVSEKIFQPFFTTKPVGEGTGLGLSISKGILDLHHATIQLNHTVKNTCFEIRFPMQKQLQDAA